MHSKTALLIKIMKFIFGDIETWRRSSKRSEPPIKGHDDISGIDDVLDTIKIAILVARATAPLRDASAIEQAVRP